MTNFFEDYTAKSLNPFRKALILILRSIGWVFTGILIAFILVGALPVIIYSLIAHLFHILADKYELNTLKAWLNVARHEIDKRVMKVFEIIYFA